jgi:hypothetical protein
MRIRLVRTVIAKPLNAHQLAKELGVDYTTVRHHLEILVKHNVLEMVGESYGAVFYLSGWLTQKGELLAGILDEKGKK